MRTSRMQFPLVVYQTSSLKLSYCSLHVVETIRIASCLSVLQFRIQSHCKDLNTSGSDAHINVRIRIVNKHRNVADKLGWEPRRKYATARFSIGFCALETNSRRGRTYWYSLLIRWNVIREATPITYAGVGCCTAAE